jgi:hypothetical protein
MKRDASSPAAYRRAVSGEQRELLEAIRSAIFSVDSDISEHIEYGMLDYPGLANLAAQKNYVSLYVLPGVLEKHRESFPGVSAGKSCLRFRRLDQLNEAALLKLLRAVRRERKKSV